MLNTEISRHTDLAKQDTQQQAPTTVEQQQPLKRPLTRLETAMQALNMLKEGISHSPVSCSMDMVRGNPTLSPAREQASTSATGALLAPATALRAMS
jgi:hypothetical protein